MWLVRRLQEKSKETETVLMKIPTLELRNNDKEVFSWIKWYQDALIRIEAREGECFFHPFLSIAIPESYDNLRLEYLEMLLEGTHTLSPKDWLEVRDERYKIADAIRQIGHSHFSSYPPSPEELFWRSLAGSLDWWAMSDQPWARRDYKQVVESLRDSAQNLQKVRMSRSSNINELMDFSDLSLDMFTKSEMNPTEVEALLDIACR